MSRDSHELADEAHKLAKDIALHDDGLEWDALTGEQKQYYRDLALSELVTLTKGVIQ